MAARGGEAKQALVVTLVLFVLSTSGLGDSTYYGMSEQEKLKGDVKKEQDKVKVADAERDWFRFQAGMYRAYLGAPAAPDKAIGRELASKKAAFDSGSLGKDPASKEYEDLPEVKALVGKLNARAPWDNAAGAPKSSYEALLASKDTLIKDLTEKLQKAESERILAQTQRTAALADRKKDKDAFDAATQKLTKDFESDRAEY